MLPRLYSGRERDVSRTIARFVGLGVMALVGGLWARALANGGPAGATEASIRGGLVPKQSTVVKLRSEELKITIDPNGRQYDVSASYVLSNPGPETTVRYGVPLLFDANEDPKAARRAADAVRIRVGDRESRCALLKETVALKPEQYENLESTPTGGWCAARLTIPSGDAVPLLLTYRADLLFRDEDFGKTAFPSLGQSVLRYVFFPAGYWIGPAERVSVTVDLGRFAGLEKIIAPPGAVKQDSKRVWTFTNVDLKKVPDLEIKIDVVPILEVAAMAKYRKAAKLRVAAKAATAAKAAGDAGAAARAGDGDPETSWCVDKPGPDSWIEITEKIDREYRECRWEGVFMTSATSDKTARIRKVRLEACHAGGKNSKVATIDLPIRSIDARGPWGLVLSSELHMEFPEAQQKAWVDAWNAAEAAILKRGCARISIIEVEGKGPACIGELAPIRACG
jgi:hypothetical protein